MITEAFVHQLRDRLAHAENEFEAAKYIDSYPRMQREKGYWAQRIQALKTQIESAERELAAEREDG